MGERGTPLHTALAAIDDAEAAEYESLGRAGEAADLRVQADVLVAVLDTD